MEKPVIVSRKPKSLLNRLRKKVRQIIRKNFALIPDGLRAYLERRMFQIHLDGPQKDIIFKLAETKDELEQAFGLLHDSYVREGFMMPKPSGLRITPYHAIPTTTTLVAKIGSKVIATVSLIRQTSLGLPVQMIYDISQVVRPGEQAVEISSLAIHPGHRGQETQLLFWLSKYVFEYCQKYFAIDHMFIAIGPWQKDLYENIILFKRLHYQEKYKFSNDAPVFVEHIDMRSYSNELISVYWNQPPERNVYAFIMVLKLSRQFQFPDRSVFTVSDPVLTPELLDYFFNLKTSAFQEMTEIQLATLHEIYRDFPAYHKVLPPSKVTLGLEARRARMRYQVKCPASFSLRGENQVNTFEIIQVSDSGFLARVQTEMLSGARLTSQVRINNFEVIEIDAVAVWSKDGLAGFRLANSVPGWEKLIAHLRNDRNKSTDVRIAGLA